MCSDAFFAQLQPLSTVVSLTTHLDAFPIAVIHSYTHFLLTIHCLFQSFDYIHQLFAYLQPFSANLTIFTHIYPFLYLFQPAAFIHNDIHSFPLTLNDSDM